MFGSREGLLKFHRFYNRRNFLIAEECDPQEVYFYEYNNHECMYSWEGDKEALDVIREYWGDETAEQIDRM